MAETVILAEQNITGFASNPTYGGLYSRGFNFGTDMETITLTLGETYRIAWDGSVHDVVAKDGSAVSAGAIYLGNAAAFGLEGSNEPFLIVYNETGVIFFSLVDAVAEHYIGIYHITEEDKQYLIWGSTLTEIGNAIREKTGGTENLTPADMPAKIRSISGGGGGTAGVDVVYITFMSDDGATELYRKPVVAGDDSLCPVVGGLMDTPTKESSAQYHYTFAGWATEANGGLDDSALKNVTGDRVLYANFIAAVRHYNIRFYDGETLLTTLSVAYGTMPEYAAEKDGYRLTGWSPELAAVTGEADYYAQWQDMSEMLGFGDCGDNATWTLTADGVLTISGTGAMEDYGVNGQPWYSYQSSITAIVVEEGITELGQRAFVGCSAAQSVILPDSLTAIGFSALANCAALTTIPIPDGVTYIGSSAFMGCSNLASITIPDGLTALEALIFNGCSKLKTVVFGSGLQYIPANTFYNPTSLTSVTFKVTSGWWYADSSSATSGTALSGLANTSTAASHLKSYYGKYWRRS